MSKLSVEKRAVSKNRLPKNGENGASKKSDVKIINIAAPEKSFIELLLVGDRPLLVNNKMNVAQELSDTYSGEGGKTGQPKPPRASDDVRYAKAFYVMSNSKHQPPHPKGKYGIPSSGIKKCVDKAIRLTGISDNSAIGSISRSFSVMAEGAGLCPITFDKLERDIRPVNIGQSKTVPEMRHRPMFHGWKCKVRVHYNPRILTAESLINLFMFGGAWVGLCELRAEKKQGECGGFGVESLE